MNLAGFQGQVQKPKYENTAGEQATCVCGILIETHFVVFTNCSRHCYSLINRQPLLWAKTKACWPFEVMNIYSCTRALKKH